jgi:hypothetical protein
MRRLLSETLMDLAQAARVPDLLEQSMRVTNLSFDVPVEVRLRAARDEIELLIDVPRWRWRTAFDEAPSRLRICWQEREWL